MIKFTLALPEWHGLPDKPNMNMGCWIWSAKFASCPLSRLLDARYSFLGAFKWAPTGKPKPVCFFGVGPPTETSFCWGAGPLKGHTLVWGFHQQKVVSLCSPRLAKQRNYPILHGEGDPSGKALAPNQLRFQPAKKYMIEWGSKSGPRKGCVFGSDFRWCGRVPFTSSQETYFG